MDLINYFGLLIGACGSMVLCLMLNSAVKIMVTNYDSGETLKYIFKRKVDFVSMTPVALLTALVWAVFFIHVPPPPKALLLLPAKNIMHSASLSKIEEAVLNINEYVVLCDWGDLADDHTEILALLKKHNSRLNILGFTPNMDKDFSPGTEEFLWLTNNDWPTSRIIYIGSLGQEAKATLKIPAIPMDILTADLLTSQKETIEIVKKDLPVVKSRETKVNFGGRTIPTNPGA